MIKIKATFPFEIEQYLFDRLLPEHRAFVAIEDFDSDIDDLDVGYSNQRKLARTVHEFAIYMTSNAGSLINYGERYHAGERISSCLAGPL